MSSRRKLQHIDPQHPPDEEDCNYCTCNVNEPVGGCLRLAEIEHGGILARGLWCLRLVNTRAQSLGYLASFFCIASAADSFRSRWGSNRKAPVWSSQASPMAAPQVPQSTDSICFGVNSLVFTFGIMPDSRDGNCSVLLTVLAHWCSSRLDPDAQLLIAELCKSEQSGAWLFWESIGVCSSL
jgi:hypothetical protein